MLAMQPERAGVRTSFRRERIGRGHRHGPIVVFVLVIIIVFVIVTILKLDLVCLDRRRRAGTGRGDASRLHVDAVADFQVRQCEVTAATVGSR